MRRAFWFRRLAQLLVILLFILLPWLNKLNYHAVQGSLFSFDLAGIPFADPASAAQAALSGALSWEPYLLEYFLGAFLSLLLAFLLGRVFCGWICPYAFFSELLHGLRTRANWPYGPRKQKGIWLAKCGVAALCLLSGSLLAWPLITFISMPGQMSLIPLPFWFNVGLGGLLALGIAPFCALLVESIVGKRLWCEYLCPQSVFLGLAAWALPKFCPGLRIRWNGKKCDCGKESPCAAACSLNINPRHKNGPPRNVCSMCGDCVKTCQKHGGALKFDIATKAKPGE